MKLDHFLQDRTIFWGGEKKAWKLMNFKEPESGERDMCFCGPIFGKYGLGIAKDPNPRWS